MLNSPCIECLRSFHVVCGVPCCCGTAVFISDATVSSDADEESTTQSNTNYDTSDSEAEWRVSSGGTRRGKRDASLKDQQSTGRKRAAQVLSLDREALCHWHDASPTNPKGGGLYPVVFGCQNTQVARHHGPDKNTLNNSEDNLSAICAFHHNNWHAKNDPEYRPGNPVMFEVAELIKSGAMKPVWTGPIPNVKKAPPEGSNV